MMKGNNFMQLQMKVLELVFRDFLTQNFIQFCHVIFLNINREDIHFKIDKSFENKSNGVF